MYLMSSFCFWKGGTKQDNKQVSWDCIATDLYSRGAWFKFQLEHCGLWPTFLTVFLRHSRHMPR
jgi:hypothetical protein